jgi:hypothetical protein
MAGQPCRQGREQAAVKGQPATATIPVNGTTLPASSIDMIQKTQ